MASKKSSVPILEIQTPPAAQVNLSTEQKDIKLLAKQPRMSSVLKGVKEGMLKAGIDTLLATIAGPIKEKIAPSLRNMGGAAELLEPAIGLAIEFALVLGIAEMISAFAPMAGGMMPGERKEEFAERGQLLGEWLREYAGERAGKQLLESAMMVLPLVMAHFSEVSLQDLQQIQGKASTEAAEVEEETTV